MNYINQSQLAERLGGMHRTTIFRHVRSGLLPAPIKVGRAVLWPEDQIDEFLKSDQSQKDQTMTVEQAKAEHQNLLERFQSERTGLGELKTKLHGANDANNAEVDARVDAIESGEDRPEGEMIDIQALQASIDVQDKIVTALNKKTMEAKSALDEARAGRTHEAKLQARRIMVQKFGLNDVSRIKFNNIADLTVSDLLDIVELQNVRVGQYSLHRLFSEVIMDEGREDRADAKQRVAAMLTA